MDEQLLKDFLETAIQDNYNWETIMPKFPELEGVDLQVLKDYAETAKQNNYNYAVINPKFPELFPAQEDVVKKKDQPPLVQEEEDMESEFPTPDGESVSTETELPAQDALDVEPPVEEEVVVEEQPQPVDAQESDNLFDRGVTASLMGKEEQEVVPFLNYQFGDEGFEFEQTGIGDAMIARSFDEDGNVVSEEEFDLDPVFSSTERDEATRLREWISSQKAAMSEKNILQTAESNLIKFKDQEEVSNTLEEFSKEQENFANNNKGLIDANLRYEQDLERYNQMVADYNDGVIQYDINVLNLKREKLEKDREQLSNMQEEVSKNIAGFQERSDLLKRSVGSFDKYKEELKEEGTWVGAFYDKMLAGIGKWTAGELTFYTEALLNAMPLELVVGTSKIEEGRAAGKEDSQIRDEALKEFKKEVLPAVRSGLEEVVGSDTTEEYIRDIEENDFILGSILGAAESAPIMALSIASMFTPSPTKGSKSLSLAAKVKKAITNPTNILSTKFMGAQVADAVDQQMMESPAFEGVSENEKMLVKYPIAIVGGILESYGISSVANRTGLPQKLTLEILKKLGSKTSAETFKEFADKEIKSRIARFGITALLGAASEAETGALQEVSDVVIKKIYGEIKGKDMFPTRDENGNYVDSPKLLSREMAKQVLEAGVREAIGGAFFSTIPAIGSAVNNDYYFNSLSNEQLELFELLINSKQGKLGVVNDIKNQITAGKITAEQGQKMLDDVNAVQGALDRIPSNYSAKNKKEALSLLMRQDAIKRKIANKDERLTKRERKEIDKIDGMLDKVDDANFYESEKQEQDAIQEPSTETVDVQESTQDSGEVGARDTEGELTEEGEAEVEAPTTEVEEEVQPVTEEVVTEFRDTGVVPEPVVRGLAVKTLNGEALTEQEQEIYDAQQEAVDNMASDIAQAEQAAEEGRFDSKGKPVPQVRPTTSIVQERIRRQARRAKRALSVILPDLNIVLHDKFESLEQAVPSAKGRRGTGGVFDTKTNTIHINLEGANTRTVAHEIFHAAIMRGIKTNEQLTKLTDKMLSSVLRGGGKALKEVVKKDAQGNDVTLKEYLEQFATKKNDKGKFVYKDSLQSEEQLAELAGYLADHYMKMGVNAKTAVKVWIAKAAKALSLGKVKVFTEAMSDNEAIELLNTIAGATATGKKLRDLKTIDEVVDADAETAELKERGFFGKMLDKVFKKEKIDEDVQLTEEQKEQAIQERYDEGLKRAEAWMKRYEAEGETLLAEMERDALKKIKSQSQIEFLEDELRVAKRQPQSFSDEAKKGFRPDVFNKETVQELVDETYQIEKLLGITATEQEVKERQDIIDSTPTRAELESQKETAPTEGVDDDGVRFQSFEGDEGQANFDRWKGDNKLYSASDIQDIKNGEPVVVDVYHGTTNDFYEFDTSVKGNVEGHLGKVNYFTSDEGDASKNYQSGGADITQRVENETERIFESLSDEGLNDELSQEDVRRISEMYGVEIEVGEDLEDASRSIAENQLVGTDEKVLNVYVKLNNPAVIGAIDGRGRGTTYMETIPESEIEGEIEGATEEIAEEYDITIEEATEDYAGEIRSRAIENYTAYSDHPLIGALQDAIDDNTYDVGVYSANEILTDLAWESEVSLSDLERAVRDGVGDALTEDGKLATGQIIADMFKNLGYDGIILTDVSKRFRGMNLGTGTSHVHVFDEFANQIKLADGRNVTFSEDTKDIRFQEGGSSAAMFENPSVISPKRQPNGRVKVKDLGAAFDKRAKELGYYIPLSRGAKYTDTQIEQIAEAMADDAELQLKKDDSGIGWYDLKTRSAMELMSRIHPELADTNSEAHLKFTLMVALISQNNTVDINFKQANDAYTYYKKNGTLPTTPYAGKSGNIIKTNIALAFKAINEMGWRAYKDLLKSSKTVKEWENMGFQVNGENKSTKITGAMVLLGSKIGSFWGNLNGDFSTLTADLWFSRMFNRYTGNTVSKKNTEKSKNSTLEELKKYKGTTLLYGYNKSDILKGGKVFEKWLSTVVKEYANGNYKDKQRLNVVSNTHFKNLAGSLQDIPRGGNERVAMRKAVQLVQDKLVDRGYPRLDIADIQAIVWYNEKDLYSLYKAVNKSSEKTDYETAAQKVLREQGVNADVALQFQTSKPPTDGRRDEAASTQYEGVDKESLSAKFQDPSSNEYTIFNVVNDMRADGYTDSAIALFLSRQINPSTGKKYTKTEVKDAMAIPIDIERSLPPAFGNVEGGVAQGQKLFVEVMTKLKASVKRMKPKTNAKMRAKAHELLKDNPIFKEQSPVMQNKLLVELDGALGTTANKVIQSEISAIKNFLSGVKVGDRQLRKAQARLKSLIRKNLPQAQYKKSEIDALIKLVSEASTDNIQQVVDEIVAKVNEKKVEILEAQIEKILKTKSITKQGDRAKGQALDIDFAEVLDGLKKDLEDAPTDPDKVQALIDGLATKRAELFEKASLTNKEYAELAAYDFAMAYLSTKNMENSEQGKVEALEQAKEILVGFVKEGRSLLKEQLKAAHESYVAQADAAFKDLTGIDLNDIDMDIAKANLKKGEEATEENLRNAYRDYMNAKYRVKAKQRESNQNKAVAAVRKMLDRVKLYWQRHEDVSGLMDIISKSVGDMFGGYMQEAVTERIDDADYVFKQGKKDMREMLESNMKRIFGKDWKKIVGVKNTKQFYTGVVVKGGEELVLSQNQIYYLYNMAKDPANEASFEADWGENWRESMDALEKLMTPQVREWADWQVNEFYPKMYERYNEVYRRVYRTNLPWNQFYAGKIHRDVAADPINMLDPKQYGAYQMSVAGGSTKMRKKSKDPIQKMDGNEVLTSYILEMERFRAFQEVLRDISKMLKNKLVSNAIIEGYGRDLYDLIERQIGLVATGGFVKGQAALDWVGSTSRFFVFNKIAGNLVVTLKQLTSIPTYANDIGTRNWLASFAKLFANPSNAVKIAKEVYNNSIYLQDRYGQDFLGVIDVYSKNSDTLMPQGSNMSDAIEMITKFGMAFTKAGDALAIFVGGVPNYTFYKSEFQKKNPTATEEQAIAYAIKKFQKDTKKTQQSGDIQDRDYYQTAGQLVKVMNLFLTTPKQYHRKSTSAYRQLFRKMMAMDSKAGKGTVWENTRTLIMYRMMMPMFFQWISMGAPALGALSDEEEDDLLRAALLGNVNALWMAGDLLVAIKDTIVGKPWAGDLEQLTLMQRASTLIRLYGRLQKTTKNLEKRKELEQAIYVELFDLFLPYKTMSRTWDNWSRMATGEEDFSWRRAVGYSDYVIDNMGEAKKEAEALEKFRKAQERMNKEKEKKKSKQEDDSLFTPL